MPILKQTDIPFLLFILATWKKCQSSKTFSLSITYVCYPEPEVANSGSFLLSSNTLQPTKPIGQNRWAFAVLLSFVLWIGQHWVSKFSEKFFLTLSLGVEIYVSVLLTSVFVGYISRSIGAEYGFLIHTMSERAMVLSLFTFYNRVFELD